ncbi:PilT/PilU family type 4a pilus ATPase [Candidatus Roizmanbacteria bacterium]|nr:PilT/PilU family type 4a pilus ATPase [Candidatus Roizmanbacteria bacterium]
MNIFELFDVAIQKQASDLHLIPGYYPAVRINEELIAIRASDILTQENIKGLILAILNEEQKQNLITNKEIDIGYEYKTSRFRINIYFTKGKLAAAFRLIGSKIRTVEELGLPSLFHKFTDYQQGLVLITGPTGEGKSTTVAAILDEINQKSPKHIVTIEDPIEYVFPGAKSIISQRELHQDTHSWVVALRSVLREDPDVVFIGEMRDYETIQSALTVAETGHLVFSTLHTGSSSETINRIIDVFPANQQNQIRSQLASVLRAVVAQRLLPSIDRSRRIPAIEVLLNIPAVAAVIREQRTHLIDNILETGEEHGMFLFEKYLYNLFKKNEISKETAIGYALRPNEITKFIR